MMRIGIMGAMPEEVDSIRTHMRNCKEIYTGGRCYYVGQINQHEVVLVFSRWGKVASAITATSLIAEFQVEQIIFTGVAGAANHTLNIGDIVISEQLYQHDMDAQPLFQKFQIPLTEIIFFTADKILQAHAKQAADHCLAAILKNSEPTLLQQFKISQPKCLLGTLATGDQFIYDKNRMQAILTEQPGVLAVEMEGAAVAQVCHDHQIPFVVIRTISDKADHSAQVDFVSFIQHIAKRYSEYIILEMLKNY